MRLRLKKELKPFYLLQAVWIAAVLFMLPACDLFDMDDDEDDDPEIPESNLSGVVEGQPWSFASGIATWTENKEQATYLTSMYDALNGNCLTPSVDRFVRMKLPRQVGEYDDVQVEYWVLVDGIYRTDYTAMYTRVIIEAADEDTIQGRLATTNDDDDHRLAGAFEVAVCGSITNYKR